MQQTWVEVSAPKQTKEGFEHEFLVVQVNSERYTTFYFEVRTHTQVGEGAGGEELREGNNGITSLKTLFRDTTTLA